MLHSRMALMLMLTPVLGSRIPSAAPTAPPPPGKPFLSQTGTRPHPQVPLERSKWETQISLKNLLVVWRSFSKLSQGGLGGGEYPAPSCLELGRGRGRLAHWPPPGLGIPRTSSFFPMSEKAAFSSPLLPWECLAQSPHGRA